MGPRVLKGVNFWDASSMVLKESVSFLPLLVGAFKRAHTCVIWSGLLICLRLYFSACFFEELDEWSLLDSHLLLCFLCSILPSMFNGWSWRRFLGLVSMAAIDLTMVLHKTWIRPNLILAGCLTMISFMSLFLRRKNDDLEMTFWSSVEVVVWCFHSLLISCHHSIQDSFWILWGILLLGSLLCLVHGETFAWKNLKAIC